MQFLRSIPPPVLLLTDLVHMNTYMGGYNTKREKKKKKEKNEKGRKRDFIDK